MDKRTKIMGAVAGLAVLAGMISFYSFNLPEKGEDNLATVIVSQDENTEKIAEVTPIFTDDNTGETVIIKSDQENYTGDKEITSYFSAQNIGKNTGQILWI